MKQNVTVTSNRVYDYFCNVIEYEYLACWTNVLEYERSRISPSMSTEYDYSITGLGTSRVSSSQFPTKGKQSALGSNDACI